MTLNNDSKFDFDLKFGQEIECELKKALEGTIEVKTERDIWSKTGNFAIEYKSRGKPSGISVTEAKHWAQVFYKDNEIICYMVFPINKIKEITRHFYKKGNVKNGGDENTSEMVMIPVDFLNNKGVKNEIY
jgi:hypothetical protein